MKIARALVASFVMALSLVAPSESDAQTLKLSLNGGLVTVDARDVSLRQVLERWAEVGGVTLLNAGLVPDTPITLQLSGATERAALATLLRSMSGYVLGPQQPGRAGAEIDRIMILPTSSAVGTVGDVVVQRPVPQPTMAAGLQREAPAVGTLTEPEPNEEPAPSTLFSLGGPTGSQGIGAGGRAANRAAEPPARPPDQPIRFGEELDVEGNRVRAPSIPVEQDATAAPGPGQTAAPANPFGVTAGAVAPGTIVPAPQQPAR